MPRTGSAEPTALPVPSTAPVVWPATRGGVPPVPAGLVVRDRLLDLVRRGADGPLTLVSAPAGTGKTVLLSSWVARGAAPGPVTWLTMDDDGPDLGRFLAGVRAAGEGVVRRVDPMVLVLDADKYSIDPALGAELDELLRRGAGDVRLVLLTRADPPLRLHRYRLDQTITEIRKADLAFTAPETTDLMHGCGLDLTGAQVEALHGRTGGWPAGLRFAAISLAGRGDVGPAIREFTGDDRNVAEYLVTEVLDAQPPDLREVLLRTSIVDELQPGLLAALTGRPEGDRMLDFLARGSSFVEPVPGNPGRYHYQSLFREFLRAQLAFEQPALVPDLHRVAADWFAGHGQLDDAVQHAIACGGWAQAAGLLVDDLAVASLITGRPRARLASRFSAMPDDEHTPAASVIRAALAINAGDPDRCRAELDRVVDQLDDEPPYRAQSCRLLVPLLQAHHAYLTGDTGAGLAAVATGEHRFRAATPNARPSAGQAMALLAECKGKLLLCRGELAPAQVALAEAAETAEAAGCEDLQMTALGLSALVEALQGHLRRATGLANEADAIAHRCGYEQTQRSAAAATALAWVRTEEYDLAASRELARRAEVAAAGRDQITTAALALVQIHVSRARGDLAGALAEVHASRVPEPGEVLPAWLDGRLAAAEADLLVAQGHRAVAGEEPTSSPAGSPRPVGTAPILPLQARTLDVQVSQMLDQATRAAEAGHPTRARTALERSLQLAAPERLRRPFFEGSAYVRECLLGGTELGARYPWLEPTTRVTEPAGVQPLTNKEREVLGHLAHLLTTEEIADTMFVSVNTVRTHVRSILRKLGVSRRNEAVRRAWDLDLIPAYTDDRDNVIDLRDRTLVDDY